MVPYTTRKVMVSVLKPFSLSWILVDNKKSQIGGNLAFIGMGFECTVLRTNLIPFFNGPPSLKNDFARYYWTMSMDHLFLITSSSYAFYNRGIANTRPIWLDLNLFRLLVGKGLVLVLKRPF